MKKYLISEKTLYKAYNENRPPKEDGEKMLKTSVNALKKVFGQFRAHPVQNIGRGELRQTIEVNGLGSDGIITLLWSPWRATDWKDDGSGGKPQWSIVVSTPRGGVSFIQSDTLLISRMKKLYKR